MISPELGDVQRQYLNAYAALDPRVAEAAELLEAGISFKRIDALYPLDLAQLTHHFADLAEDESRLPQFLDLMKDSGMGLISDRASNEVLDQFFLMPEELDFSHPEFQKLSDATASEDVYLDLMTDSSLQDALTALGDALWLGSRWAQFAAAEDQLVGVTLVKVLEGYRIALQTLDRAAPTAVS